LPGEFVIHHHGIFRPACHYQHGKYFPNTLVPVAAPEKLLRNSDDFAAHTLAHTPARDPAVSNF